MADIVDRSTRSRIMSRIKGRDTRPEMEIRKKLFARGFRYRLHDKKLPGKPDMVFPKYKAVVLFNGCFWHVHDCYLFKWPTSQVTFWKKKLTKNKENDRKNNEALKKLGWRILTIWECSYRSPGKKDWSKIDSLVPKIEKWLYSIKKTGELRG